MYKMANIRRKTWGKNEVEAIAFNGICWLNEKNVEELLGCANLVAITRRYDPKYRKHRYELVDNPKKQPNRTFLYEGITIGIIKDCRTAKACSFKRRLGFKLHDVFNKKQQTVVETIREVFKGENMKDEYYVLRYRIDLYFHDYRLAIEVDEFGHW